MPPVNKRHAIVHTAAIDVKIMRLDKKQVTLSVFRQVKEKNIFNLEFVEAGEDVWKPRLHLLGTPWGIVNYVWDKCEPWVNYHLVWQAGNAIYRMALPLVKGLKNHYLHGKERTWGCRSCDETAWGRQRTQNEANGRSRCWTCSRKCGYFNIDNYMAYGWGFLRSIGESEIWWAAEDEEAADKEALNLFIQHMVTFETLDQLFIAV